METMLMEQVQISDIGLAAYLKVVKGIDYADLPSKEGPKFIFSFNISKDQLQTYSSEYLNSDYRRMDQEIRTLKKMMHG